MGIVYELQVTADEDPGAQVEKTDFLLSSESDPPLEEGAGPGYLVHVQAIQNAHPGYLWTVLLIA